MIKIPVKKTISEPRKTAPQLRKENEELRAELQKLQEGAFCYMCGKHKPKKNFYVSSDTAIRSGVSRVCKKCVYDIVHRRTETGEYQEPTKASVMTALEYLDRPFLNKVWDSSYFECHKPEELKPINNGKNRDIFSYYIKNIQSLSQYQGLRWKDSDIFKTNAIIGQMDAVMTTDEERRIEKRKASAREAQLEAADINRKRIIALIGYDPYEFYPDDNDKPFLYGSLSNQLDEETVNDGMKLRAVLEIIRSHNQLEKLNRAIDAIICDPATLLSDWNIADKYAGMKDKLIKSSNALAKDNGISVNFNNNKSKGANTLSGKIKELSEKHFEGANINTFDIETCRGMLQVAELSEEARHKQIGYDENIAQEIKDIKVGLIESLTREKEAAQESLRILLKENLELKDFLKEQGLINSEGKVIDNGI